MENQTINNLHNLMDYDAGKFLCAEVELKNSLPKWINNVDSFQLKTILHKYLEFIAQHMEKLEEFVDQEQMTILSANNSIMQTFIKDTEERLSYCTNAEVRDACLLACIQTMNHYKICAFGTAAAFASVLELEKNAAVFREAEINEKHIDDRLSQLALYEINAKARSPIVIP